MSEMTTPLRQAIATRLNQSPDITAAVAGRVYLSRTPKALDLVYPFLTVGLPIETRAVLHCEEASRIDLAISVFGVVDGRDDSNNISALTSAVMAALKTRDDITPADGCLELWRRLRTDYLFDQGASLWRAVIQYQALMRPTQPR